MLDEIIIGVGGEICLNALQAFKEVSRINSDEAVDADIPDIGRRAIDPVANVAMFKNILAAGTFVKLFADLNTDQVPFKPSCLERF